MLKDLSDSQVRIATEQLVEDGKLRAVDLYNALRAVRARAQRVLQLTGAVLGSAKANVRSGGFAVLRARHEAERTVARTAPRAATPAQKQSRKLQGQYLGLLNRIPEPERAGFRQMAQEDRRKAIAAMRKRLGGRSRKRATK